MWKNGQAPALNAENLNKIEQGIANSAQLVDGFLPVSQGGNGSTTITPELVSLTGASKNEGTYLLRYGLLRILIIDFEIVSAGDRDITMHTFAAADRPPLGAPVYRTSLSCTGQPNVYGASMSMTAANGQLELSTRGTQSGATCHYTGILPWLARP